MAGAAGAFLTRAFESMLKECSNKKYPALQTSIQSYLDGAKDSKQQPSSSESKQASHSAGDQSSLLETDTGSAKDEVRPHEQITAPNTNVASDNRSTSTSGTITVSLATAGNTLGGAETELVLNPLQLAFETKNPKVVELALDCLHECSASGNTAFMQSFNEAFLHVGHRLIPQHIEITHFANRLKRCSSLKELESLYAFMTKSNAAEDCFLINQFITACSKFHAVEWAIAAFAHMKNPNIFVYNALIGAFLHCSRPVDALLIYSDMLKTEINPSSYTFPSVIKSCTLVPAEKLGKSIHGQVWKYGFGLHIHVQTSLIDFYSNLGRVLESRVIFDNMTEKDGFAWTTVIAACIRSGDLSSARKLFSKMPEKSTASWNTMIHGFARIEDVESAEDLFKKMPEKDLISWTTMINCYSQNKHYREAINIFSDMKDNGINPDEVTMSTIISACAHLGLLDLGKEIHLYVIQNQFHLDVYIGSALIDMYAKCGAMERALVVFFKLQEKNLFCWNSVIEGLAVHGYAGGALAMFQMMEKEKVKPNGVTFVSVLTACTHAGLVEDGRSIFQKMTCDLSIPPEIEHYGCMVDLLCKAGLLEEALDLMKNMRMEPNSVIWGALLGGCKLHKDLEIAEIAVQKLMSLEPNNSGYYTLLIHMYAEANRWSEVAMIRARMKNFGVQKRSPGSSWIEVEKKMVQFAACDNYHAASKEIYLLLGGLVGQLKLPGYKPEVEFIL